MDFKALEYICAISEAQTISQAAKTSSSASPRSASIFPRWSRSWERRCLCARAAR